MDRWIARYEEGFVDDEGTVTTVTDELRGIPPRSSPEELVRQWLTQGEIDGASTRPFANGLEQTDDVAERPDFRALRVVRIWRRITFEPSAGVD